ncbi:MAG: helix-turn-helix domain-containing protein [Acidobacteria bacterium]|nr:helix-turn-helix domain-containing protein [Acidobacteriota bacterium]
MQPNSADRLLTRDEVAEILRVHPDTVYALVRERKIPAVKIGGQWRFSEVLLWEWIYETTVQPGAEANDVQREPGLRGRLSPVAGSDENPRLSPTSALSHEGGSASVVPSVGRGQHSRQENGPRPGAGPVPLRALPEID